MTTSRAAHEEQNIGYVTAILDIDRLRMTKKRIAGGDKTFSPALDTLRREADQWCAKGPFTVTEKTFVPSSGDKHDYVSLGLYWWPDPASKDGLPYIRRDGEVNPEGVGDVFDRVRMEAMTAGVETLALAWYFTGEEKYAQRAALYITTWFLDPATRMNPHLRFGQAIPGRCEGRGIGLIDTRRLVEVINAVAMLEGTSFLTSVQQQEMKAWFRDFLQWMRESPYGIDESKQHNNHGTWYDVQAACFALFAGEHDFARSVLEPAVQKRLGTQIAADGSQPHELARTRTFNYSLMNLGAFLALTELGRRVGVDFWAYEPAGGGSLLRLAIDFLAPYADPAKPWPHPQITPLDRVDIFPYLRQGRVFTGDSRYEELNRKLPQQEAQAHRANLLWPIP